MTNSSKKYTGKSKDTQGKFLSPAVDKALDKLKEDIKKIPVDKFYTTRNRLSRGRGYSFEYDIVQKFKNAGNGWDARRLGGSSTGLPDVIATNNSHHVNPMICWECKSVKDKNQIWIERKQILRIMHTLQFFGKYNHPIIGFAFRFQTSDKMFRLKPIYRFCLFSAFSEDFGDWPDEYAPPVSISYNINPAVDGITLYYDPKEDIQPRYYKYDEFDKKFPDITSTLEKAIQVMDSELD